MTGVCLKCGNRARIRKDGTLAVHVRFNLDRHRDTRCPGSRSVPAGANPIESEQAR